MAVFSNGDAVRVRDDAPVHADLTGTIVDEQTYGWMHGYWISPGPGCVNVWGPDGSLSPEAGEIR